MHFYIKGKSTADASKRQEQENATEQEWYFRSGNDRDDAWSCKQLVLVLKDRINGLRVLKLGKLTFPRLLVDRSS